MIDIVKLFCSIDDFCTSFQKNLDKQSIGKRSTRGRKATLSTSEAITLCVLFHQSGFMNIKRFYQEYALKHLKQEFPDLPSYCRFIQQRNSCLFFFFNYLQTFMSSSQGVAIIDSTPLILCHSKRASSCKLFSGKASKGKTTKGWFYGLKLHFVVNHQGELIRFLISSGKESDLTALPYLAKDLQGWLLGDKGYLSSKITRRLYHRGLKLVTKIRKNMKNQLMDLWEKLLLKKRGLIESVLNQLKTLFHLEHTRHRSERGWVSNLLCSLIAYCHYPKKPRLKISENQLRWLEI